MDLQRSSASTNLRVWWELRNRGVPIGIDAAHNRPVNLKLSRLATHLSVIGPTGFGKTRWLLRKFRKLLHVPNASVVFINPKGAAGRQARDIAIEEGQERRLDYFRPGDADALCGYNPMQANHLPIESHAKSVRESIRSAHGQMDFTQTRQLARMLYLALVIARSNGLGLVEALQLLRPGSRLRSDLLPTIEDPQLKEAFAYFHGMRDQMQQELALSAIAMLEPFVTDATIRRVLTHTPSLDLSHIIHEGRVLVVDIPIGQPLRLDDVKLFGRFFTNDLANRVLERSETEAREHPVFFIVDEAPLFLTEDFCHILRLGREPGLHAIIAHQDLGQLRAADPTGNVYASVMGSCRLYGRGEWCGNVDKRLTHPAHAVRVQSKPTMKTFLRLFLSALAGFVWLIILFLTPIGALLLSAVENPLSVFVPSYGGAGLGFFFNIVTWLVTALPAALIVGAISFFSDRTRPWMAVLAALLCEVVVVVPAIVLEFLVVAGIK